MNTRWIGSGLLGFAGLAALGCATAYPGAPTPGELANHLTLPEDSGQRYRGQRADEAPIQLAQAQVGAPQGGASQIGAPQIGAPQYAQPIAPIPTQAPASALPPPLPPPLPLTMPTIAGIPAAPGTNGLPIPPPPKNGLSPTSLSAPNAGRVPVRAWVNGRPIFDDEVLLSIEMTMPHIVRQPDRQVFLEGFNKVLNNMIDMEVAYQEAVHKLEKGNPQALVKLKEYVDEDFQKQSKSIKNAMPPEKFAEFAPVFRRQIERQLIGMEFVRSFVDSAPKRIGTEDLKDYYDTHSNEFQKISTVKWQHVFLAVNAQHPTPEKVLDLADNLLEQVRRGSAFLDLVKYDDGDAKAQNGKGWGTHKGEIRPVELEEYLFSKMKPGDVGRLQMSTGGVHLFRLVERVDGGLTPFNDTVQTQIRNKMKTQILDREFKRFIKELRERAIVEYEKGA
jgi:PPIC-type PPIASE domain